MISPVSELPGDIMVLYQAARYSSTNVRRSLPTVSLINGDNIVTQKAPDCSQTWHTYW